MLSISINVYSTDTYTHLQCQFMVKFIYISLYHSYRVNGLHIMCIMRQEMKMSLGGVPFICLLRRKRENCLMDISWQSDNRMIKSSKTDWVKIQAVWTSAPTWPSSSLLSVWGHYRKGCYTEICGPSDSVMLKGQLWETGWWTYQILTDEVLQRPIHNWTPVSAIKAIKVCDPIQILRGYNFYSYQTFLSM